MQWLSTKDDFAYGSVLILLLPLLFGYDRVPYHNIFRTDTSIDWWIAAIIPYYVTVTLHSYGVVDKYPVEATPGGEEAGNGGADISIQKIHW